MFVVKINVNVFTRQSFAIVYLKIVTCFSIAFTTSTKESENKFYVVVKRL